MVNPFTTIHKLSSYLWKGLRFACRTHSHLHLGNLADTFIQSDFQYVLYVCHKKEKQQCKAVSTVRMFIEPSSRYTTEIARISINMWQFILIPLKNTRLYENKARLIHDGYQWNVQSLSGSLFRLVHVVLCLLSTCVSKPMVLFLRCNCFWCDLLSACFLPCLVSNLVLFSLDFSHYVISSFCSIFSLACLFPLQKSFGSFWVNPNLSLTPQVEI